jgi:hypothetical protein
VALGAEAPPVLVEARWFICAFSMSADSLLYHDGMEGSWWYDFYKPLPGVFLSQPLSCYAQQSQLLASFLLGLWHKFS